MEDGAAAVEGLLCFVRRQSQKRPRTHCGRQMNATATFGDCFSLRRNDIIDRTEYDPIALKSQLYYLESLILAPNAQKDQSIIYTADELTSAAATSKNKQQQQPSAIQDDSDFGSTFSKTETLAKRLVLYEAKESQVHRIIKVLFL